MFKDAMSRDAKCVAVLIPVFIGSAFLGAGFNDAGSSSNDTLFRVLGIALLVVAFAAMAWLVRGESIDLVSAGVPISCVGVVFMVLFSDSSTVMRLISFGLIALGTIVWLIGARKGESSS